MIKKLLDIMERLRNPENGCPWDIEQTFETIVPYTIEEAYEVLDAINKSDYESLKDELGDLLLQVVYHSRMAEEKDLFDFNDVVDNVCEKMIRRHPHVFGDADADEWAKANGIWETQKAEERDKIDKYSSILDGVALALPALLRGLKLQNRAARVGFDWPDAIQTMEKLEEELSEVKEEIAKNSSKEKIEEEIGDLLFACTNLARKLDVDAEIAMRKANDKFEFRFKYLEKQLKEKGKSLENSSLEQMEELWQEAKKYE